MVLVCTHHVKEGIKILNVPHIKKIRNDEESPRCLFCNHRAEFKFFYDTPISKRYKQNLKRMIHT